LAEPALNRTIIGMAERNSTSSFDIATEPERKLSRSYGVANGVLA
jgi:hypothetical protein